MDFSPFFDALQSIGDLIVDIKIFLTVDIFVLIAETFTEWVTYFVVAKIEYQLYFLTISFDAALAVLDQLDISTLINNSFALLDSQLLSFLTRYRVIEGINLVTASTLTRFIWGFF